MRVMQNQDYFFLQGGGEMGELIRSLDWSQTAIGSPDTWPQSLQIATSIMLSTPFPMYIAWGSDYIQLYNDGYRPILGSTKHPQAMGISTRTTFAEIWHIIDTMFDGVMEGKAVGFPNFMLPLERNGYVEECYFDFSYSPIRHLDGQIGGVLVTVVETTENVKNLAKLKESNRALISSESRFRSLIQQAPAAICNLVGEDLVIDSANDKILRLWGKSDDIIGKRLADALPELDGQAFIGLLKEVYTSGEPYHGSQVKAKLEHHGQLEDYYFNFVYHPLKDDTGACFAVMVLAIDVTDLVVANKALEQTYEQARLSKEAAQLGTFDMDLTKGTMHWDERCRLLFGISHQGAVTYEKDFVEGLHPDDRERVTDIIDKLFVREKSNGDYDVEYRTVGLEDRKQRWVRAKGKVFFDTDDKPLRFIGSVLEITDQVESRRQIERAKNNLRMALDSAKMGTWSADLETRFLTISEQSRVLHGIPAGLEQSLDQAMELIFPEHREQVNKAIQHSVNSGESFETEYQITPMDGAPARWLKSTGIAHFDDRGKPTTISGTILDITERKEIEQRKDDFLSIASHELKTPITTLKASIQLLDRIKDAPSPVILPKLIEQSGRSMQKISSLVEDLLNVGRMNDGQLQLNKGHFNVKKMLGACCQQVTLDGRHEVKIEGDDTINVYADEHRVDQVVINFINNAVKYAPESKEIVIAVTSLGDLVKISVTDTGPGIAPSKVPHLFDRYYRAETSSFQNSGLGLGLYISAQIIKKHNGDIGVNSEPGKGSTFWFTIPQNG